MSFSSHHTTLRLPTINIIYHSWCPSWLPDWGSFCQALLAVKFFFSLYFHNVYLEGGMHSPHLRRKIYGPWPLRLEYLHKLFEFFFFMGDISSPIYLFIYLSIWTPRYLFCTCDNPILLVCSNCSIFGMGTFSTWLLCSFDRMTWRWNFAVFVWLGFVYSPSLSVAICSRLILYISLVVFRSAIIPRHSGYCYCKGCKKPRSGH